MFPDKARPRPHRRHCGTDAALVFEPLRVDRASVEFVTADTELFALPLVKFIVAVDEHELRELGERDRREVGGILGGPEARGVGGWMSPSGFRVRAERARLRRTLSLTSVPNEVRT